MLEQVGEDPRPVMRAAYACFREGTPPEGIMAAVDRMRGSHDAFYAYLVRLGRTCSADVSVTQPSCSLLSIFQAFPGRPSFAAAVRRCGSAVRAATMHEIRR